MRKIFVGLFIFGACLSINAQRAYMIDNNAAVFYPSDYDADAHLPSPVFSRELIPQGDVPASWKVRPTYSSENGNSVATLTVSADDDLYGTGEVIGPLRRNGKNVVFWNKDNYGYLANEGKNLYQSHPWVLGVRKDGTAYGIIADNTWRGECTTGQQIKFSFESPAFRVIVIEGKDSKEVMKELGRLTGTMELPPLWALGYQQCRYSYHPESRVKEIVDSMRQERIPCDAVWMDIDYMDKFKVFTFDKQQFPDPKALHDYVNDRHMKCIYMIDPGVKVEDGYFVYDQGKASNYFVKGADGKYFEGRVWPGQCNFPDFTRPEVRTWWSGLTRDYMKKGVDGLWNDMNEPSVFEGKDINGNESGTMREDAQHGYPPLSTLHSPLSTLHFPLSTFNSHLRYHNIYGLNMIRASREGMLWANPQNRPFVLSRSNFLGGQKYGATWNGDNVASWEHLLQSIPMTLNLSLSGQPFNGPDMGGFATDCDAELLAHWYATGIYFPFARNHAAVGTVNQEPWSFGKKIEDVCRTAVERRYKLMPYIYTLFHEASTDGMPVMRPVFMADEKDANLRSEDRVYMLGGDLMIIPRWTKNPALPSGDWDIIPFEIKDDGYQAFVALRPGAVVPTCEVAQSTQDLDMNTLTLLVNPDADGNASGTLYQDAGNGYDYKTGGYAMYELKATTEGGQVKITMTQTDGNMQSAHKIRIALVCDGKITYSPYVEGNEVGIKAVKDKQLAINPSKLKWAAIDPSQQPSTGRKLYIHSHKMDEMGLKNDW